MSSSPSKELLEMLRRINNVQVGGVTGTKTKLTMMGKWKNPVIPNSASLPSLYIPNSPYVIVSVSQLLQELQGHAYLTWKKAYIWNATGVVASATVKDGLYIQDDVRPDMTLGDLLEFMESATTGREEEPLTVATFHQSLHHLKQLHDSYNHESYAKIRAIHGFPPASTESPDPVCGACQTAGTRRPNITQSSKEEPTRPWQTLCMDISRKMPADKRGNQRFLMVQDMFTDHWTALLMKRKSDATKVVEEMILQINNKYLPHRVSMIHCDMDTCFVKDSRFREMLASYGVQLRPSPPNDQAKNPAENVMKRAQRQMQATMARSNMPKGSWSYALLHVCYVHSVTPRLNRASPQEEATGIKPTWKPTKVFGAKCFARLYHQSKLRATAVECVYLGRDNFCNADIVRPYNNKLASGTERYASVTKHEPEVFPYVHPTVPRPRDYPSERFDSDTQSDADGHDSDSDGEQAPLNVQSGTVLAVSPGEQTLPKRTEAKERPEPEPERAHPAVKNRRPRAMSTKALQQFQTFLALNSGLHDSDSARQSTNMIDKPRYYYCGVLESYVSSDTTDQNSTDPDNPFKHLFNPEKETIWADPKSLREVYQHRMKDYYLAAMLKERDAWIRNKVYRVILKKDIPIDPRTGRQYVPMRTQPVWKTKLNRDNTVDKFKYRLCINGKQQDKSKALCYEPMVAVASLKVFFDLVVRYDLKYRKADAQEFFLNFPVREGEHYFMNLPPGWHPEYSSDKFCAQLDKAVYGIPTATQTAGGNMNSHIVGKQFDSTVHDPRVYVKWETPRDIKIIMVHVDDCIYASTTDRYLDEITSELNELCPMTECKRPDTFRGIEITDSDNLPDGNPHKPSKGERWIKLSQETFAKDLPKQFGYEGQKIPDVPCPALNSSDDHAVPVQAKRSQILRYMRIQGCLQWLMLTMPSCNFTVNWLSRAMQNPQPRHEAIQKQCLLYMASVADQGCYFHRKGPPDKLQRGAFIDDLEGAADATWVDRQEYPKAYSTTGYVYKTKIGTLLYATARQNNVTCSSCESEVMSNKTCCQQGMWIRGLYKDLGFNFSKPTVVLQDNQSAIATCVGEGHHKLSRHFRVACHFLKELVDHRVFAMQWRKSVDMYADIMTKSLPRHSHKYHEATLVNMPHYLRTD